MKKNSLSRRLAAFVMTFVMVLSLTSGFSAVKVQADSDSSSITFEKIENAGRGRLAEKQEAIDATVEPEYADDEMVRVSIVLDGESTMEKGYKASTIETNAAAKSYRQSLKQKQDTLAAKISKEVLGGETLDVKANLTLAANIISAYVPYGKINEIKTFLEVEDVVIENYYEPEATAEVTDPDMAVASDMTGTTAVWASGYTGAGSTVAIVDTGLDTDHQSFSAEGFDYAISQLDKEVDLLTNEEVAAKWDQLNASDFIENVADTYLNTKVPYAVNYVDGDLDVTHDNDTQGEHGSHVAGIAAANRFIPTEDGTFEDALSTVKTQGQAPDAQILVMKVFGKGGGAYDSDYFMAIEDAMVLGAASVNLSLGSANAGLSYNTTYQDILDALTENGTVYAGSAGNNYDWTEANIGSGYMYADDVNYATGGSPGSYANSLSTASIDNDGAIGMPMVLDDGTFVFYDDGASANNAPMTSIASDEDYTYVAVLGTGDDFGDIPMEGKIAVCARGDISFYVKANNAVAKGAVATIIYNNQPGTISMNLSGYTGTAPAVSITQADGLAMIAAGEEKTTEGGYTYYEGKVKVTDTYQVGHYNSDYLTMSDFSSWGVPGNLSLKPEITTPGGNIWSVNGAVAGGKAYEIMSGTSMAAPQTAGMSAVLGQYIRENGLLEKTGKTQRQLIQSLLMSTAKPVIEEATDNYYSVMKQGSGLADIKAATEAKSYIMMDETATVSAADGKVKAELGEVERTADGKAEFDVAFTVNNMSDEDTQYAFNADFFTQDIWETQGISFRDTWTTPVDAAVVWTVDGEEYTNSDYVNYDFDGNGAVNALDAQRLLEINSGESEELFNEEYADIDGDKDIDTYDAYLAFKALNEGGAEVKAGGSIKVNAHVVLNAEDKLFGEEFNGNYIEGYLFVKEADTAEGVLGVEHSIPVLGFYGNWSDASMFDRGSYLDYLYELEELDPYMAYTSEVGNSAYTMQTYLVQYAGSTNAYPFGGNPLGKDETYHPERNAINSNDTISGVRYSQIRNSVAGRFNATSATGKVLRGSEKNYGTSYGAYYYRNGAQWRNTSATTSIGYKTTDLAEGTKLNLNYTLVPEYYRNADGTINWDGLGKGATYSVPAVVDNSAPYIVSVTGNEERTELTVKAHDNQYIAAVAVYTDDGEEVDTVFGLEDILKGEQHDYTFKLTDAEEAHYLVEVYDYALNLSTYKINFNEEELDGDYVVTVTADSNRVLAGNTTKVTADVQPWGVDDSVVWTSSDETIATVDDNGIVTGVAAGTVTITATSMVDEEASDSVEIEVFTIPMTALGVLQNESGTPLLFGYDLENGTKYEAFGEVDPDLTAATWDMVTEDGQYFYQQDSEGYMHKIDIDTLETAEKSAATTAFGAPVEDIAFPFNVNIANETQELFGVAEGYLLYSDTPMANTFNRGYNLGTYLRRYTGASQFIAVAWGGKTSDGGDEFVALDNAGYLWLLDYSAEGGLSLGYIPSSLSVTLASIGDTTGNSLVMGNDGEFYLAHFDGNTSEIYQLAWNSTTSSFDATRVTDVGADVWPAALLAVAENESEEEGQAVKPVMTEAVVPAEAVVKVAEFTKEDLVEVTAASDEKVSGGLNAVSGDRGPVAEINKVSADINVSYVTEDVNTNGLVEFTYDPAVATVTKIQNYADHFSVYEEDGKIVVAYAYDEEVEADTEVVRVSFEKGSLGEVDITIVQENNDQPKDKVETVLLSDYTGPEWKWEEDGSAATAIFTVIDSDKTIEVEAEVTVKEEVAPTCEEDGYTVYEAVATFDGKDFTDTLTVAGEKATGHKYGEPTWTWAEDNSSAKATFVCENDETHVVEVEAEITVTVVDPTTSSEGLITCTATVTGPDGNVYTDVKTEAIPKLDANFRVYGESYYESAFVVANRMKEELGVEKFDAIVVARGTGESGFADALGGSYLAAEKNAPILLMAGSEDADEADVRKAVEAYIAENLNKGGVVYILGGEAAISADFETELKEAGVETKRYAGANRWATNIEILEDLGVTGGEITVVNGSAYADSLSAAATGKPILLVNGTTETLRKEQIAYLDTLKDAAFTVIGGEAAVIPAKYDLVAAYGETKRIAGADRYLTSVEVAKAYFPEAKSIVIANGTNSNGYADGLISGALAAAIDAPMILTRNNEKTTTVINSDYVGALTLEKIYVVGNSEVVTDDTVLQITGLETMDGFVVVTE